MQEHQAIEMLSIPGGFKPSGQKWVDFGCGTGTFTLALAHHLNPKSHIVAVDKNCSSLNQIPNQFNDVSIEKKCADLKNIDFPPTSLNGILMANSLHYVQHQEAFIEKITDFLKPDGCFLIVEYNTHQSNPWIPYPLSFDSLEQLFKTKGFPSIKKINEIPSRYNRSNLYSVVAQNLSPKV